VGLGTEVPFILVLGLLVLGPKQPQAATSRLHLQPEFTALHHQRITSMSLVDWLKTCRPSSHSRSRIEQQCQQTIAD
jgi:hypothetical protein